jgi:seryl-tRNA synthetase
MGFGNVRVLKLPFIDRLWVRRYVLEKDGYQQVHIDLKRVSQNSGTFKEIVKKRGLEVNIDRIVSLYTQKCDLERRLNYLKHEKNRLSKISSWEKREENSRGRDLKENISKIQSEYNQLKTLLFEETMNLPNEIHPETPIGDESCARIIETIHEFPKYTFDPKDHLELCKLHNLIDFENAAHVTGSQFYYLRNEAAQMEISLIHYAMSMAIKEGFIPYIVPDIVKSSITNGCGYQSRGEATQIYSLDSPHKGLCLSATAEIPLAGMYSNQILPYTKLPIHLVAFSHCFRSEAGSRGKESKGLFRVHQFSKVELFSFTRESQSEEAFQKIINTQKKIIKGLNLHARILEMPTKELGLSAYRKVDIEAWMPGRGIYGEISSTSNCTDFQGRRLNIQYKDENNETHYVHTVNGTACAIPRVIISVLEQHQRIDGSVQLPHVLHKLMDRDYISK